MTWGDQDFCGFARSRDELCLDLAKSPRPGHPSQQQKARWLALAKLHTLYTWGFGKGLCSASV